MNTKTITIATLLALSVSNAQGMNTDQSAECIATMSGRLKTLQAFLRGCETTKEITEQLTLLKEHSGFPKDDPLPKEFLSDHKHELLASAQVGVELARIEAKAWIKNYVKTYSVTSYTPLNFSALDKTQKTLAARYENALANQMLITTFLDQNKP